MSGVELRTEVPHSARIYDYLLGGKDNFEADRRAAAEIVKATPNMPISMRANRNYIARVATVTAHNPAAVRGVEAYKARGIPAKSRTDTEVAGLFRGLELIEPGVTLVSRWRPDPAAEPVDDDHVLMSGGVAVKP